MNKNNAKERFNNFWVSMFSIMVGYLIYFFVGNKLASKIVKHSTAANIVGIFFMITCILGIYMLLNFMLERKLPKYFKNLLWTHYIGCFIVFMFFINAGTSRFTIKFFDHDVYNLITFMMMVFMNVTIFIPIGYLLRKEVFMKSISFMILLILTIEFSQFVFNLGAFDINEIFFKIIGCCIGYFNFQKKKKKKKRKRKKRQEAIVKKPEKPIAYG